MSDYEVTLVDGKMSEFFVKFHGPAESVSIHAELTGQPLTCSTIRQGSMEDTCRATRELSLQVSQYRIYEQDLPSQYR